MIRKIVDELMIISDGANAIGRDLEKANLDGNKGDLIGSMRSTLKILDNLKKRITTVEKALVSNIELLFL